MDALLYAGGEEGWPPIMTKGHVLHRGPLRRVPSLQSSQDILYCHADCIEGGGGGGWGGGGRLGS